MFIKIYTPNFCFANPNDSTNPQLRLCPFLTFCRLLAQVHNATRHSTPPPPHPFKNGTVLVSVLFDASLSPQLCRLVSAVSCLRILFHMRVHIRCDTRNYTHQSTTHKRTRVRSHTPHTHTHTHTHRLVGLVLKASASKSGRPRVRFSLSPLRFFFGGIESQTCLSLLMKNGTFTTEKRKIHIQMSRTFPKLTHCFI